MVKQCFNSHWWLIYYCGKINGDAVDRRRGHFSFAACGWCNLFPLRGLMRIGAIYQWWQSFCIFSGLGKKQSKVFISWDSYTRMESIGSLGFELLEFGGEESREKVWRVEKSFLHKWWLINFCPMCSLPTYYISLFPISSGVTDWMTNEKLFLGMNG